MFRITNEWLVEHRTKGGGYNKRQLNIFGIEWPPGIGWKNTLIGKDIDIRKAKEFEQIANTTKNKESILRSMGTNTKPWEDKEVLTLLKYIQKNATIDYIAEKHARSKEEITTEIRQIAKDYWFNDKRPIEEIQLYTRLCKEEIEEIIASGESTEDDWVPDYYVYTDGACSNNGRLNAKAGMGIYFGSNDPRNVSKQIEGKQTNNTAELGAMLLVYTIVQKDIEEGKKITIVSDSTYAIQAFTCFGEKCAKNKWIKEMPNKEMVKEAYELARKYPNVRFKHVLGHTEKDDEHSIGNNFADMLANLSIGCDKCPYLSQQMLTPHTSF